MNSALLFYILAFISIVCALLVITSKNPIHSCLFLVLTMFSISANYFLLNAQFLGIVQLIVYAGAIMVLFLFTLMMLNLNVDSEPKSTLLKKIIGVFSGGTLLLVLTVFLVKSNNPTENTLLIPSQNQTGLIKNLGNVLLTNYVFPFEVISILIITALVGTVVLATKDKKEIVNVNIED